MKNIFSTIRVWALAHKAAATAIVAVVIVGGIGMYRSAKTADAEPEYVLSPVTTGSIIQTVTGSGQVSAANQIDVTPQASGAITSIDVTVGQHVQAGDLLATIDDTSAAASLENSKLSLAQLTEPAKPGDIANDQASVAQSYEDGYNDAASTFSDLQTIMPGLNNMFYTQNGFLSDQRITILGQAAQNDVLQANTDYNKASIEYQTVLAEYKSLDRTSATSSIQQLINDTYNLSKDVSTVVQDTQAAITWITVNQSSYNTSGLTTAEASVTSWSNSINNDVTSLSQASDTIASDANTLNNLITGADPLAVQASELSVQQSQQSYDNYFVRAPFSGVVGRIPASLYAQASGSTIIATIVGDQKISVISLDEVDAAKVKVGDPVSITFDAINNFTATGTVSEVDLVGTVTQGVVSYNIKVTINTADPRILPGMSLNVTITTNELDNVTIVPSAAVKTQGTRSYVQAFPAATVRAYMQSLRTASGQTASSTRSFSGAGMGGGFGSTTASTSQAFGGGIGSTTRSFTGTGTSGAFAGRTSTSVTLPSATAPATMTVTIGQSDSTNTQIASGLTPGEWVVTRTIAGSSGTTASAAAPSILSSLGGGARTGATGGAAARGGFSGGGAVRVGG